MKDQQESGLVARKKAADGVGNNVSELVIVVVEKPVIKEIVKEVRKP